MKQKRVKGYALITRRGALIEAAQQKMNVGPSLEQESHGCYIVPCLITYQKPITKKRV